MKRSRDMDDWTVTAFEGVAIPDDKMIWSDANQAPETEWDILER